MATSMQVADGIRDLNVEWDDPAEFHQILVHLHEIVRATQERLQAVADRLDETPLRQEYQGPVAEAAGSMSGIADQLQQVTGGGVLRR